MIIHGAHIVGFTLALIVIALAGAVTYDRAVIPTVTLSARAVNSPVKAGSDLLIENTLLRHRSCPGRIDGYLYDGRHIRTTIESIEVGAQPLDAGKPVQMARLVPIPASAAPGDAYYAWSVTFTCPFLGYWQSHKIVPAPKVYFEIAP